jgi:replicative DNA helicase
MQTLSSPQLVEKWIELQRNRHEHPNLFALKSTGLLGLDNILGGGIEWGQYVIIGGPQKSGKSTLMQHMALEDAKHGDPFLFMSAEMTNMSTATRLFSNIARIAKDKIRRIELGTQDWEDIERAAETIKEYQGYWNYGFSKIEDIKAVKQKILKEKGVHVRKLYIDYFQLMEGSSQGNNRVEQLAAISRGFKRMCVEEGELNILIVSSQLRRESIRSHTTDANSFLGTGALERDMDVGIIISELKDESGKGEIPNARRLTVVGSRDTDVGFCDITFRGETATIRDRVRDKAAVSLDYWRQ